MDRLMAVVLLAAVAAVIVTYFVPIRVPIHGKMATRVAVYFHRFGFTAIPMVSGGAYEVLQATLGAVAAAGGTTVPAELGEVPVTETEQNWSLAKVTVTSPTLVTGATATAGTINIRQVRQNALLTTPVSAGGSGYTSAPVVNIAPPTGAAGQPLQANQRQAAAHAVLTTGAVSSIVIDDPGAGYTAAPVITLSGGGGSGATCTSPTVGAVVVGTLATLALITGVNLPAEAPVNIPLSAAPVSPLMDGDVLDFQYVQISTGTALVAGTKVEAELN